MKVTLGSFYSSPIEAFHFLQEALTIRATSDVIEIGDFFLKIFWFSFKRCPPILTSFCHPLCQRDKVDILYFQLQQI